MMYSTPCEPLRCLLHLRSSSSRLPVCAAASFCSLLNFCLGWWQIPDIQTEHVEEAPGGWQGWRELLKALFSDQHLLAVCFLSFCQA